MFENLHLTTLMFVDDLKLKRDERGATTVEYGLMVAFIAAVIVTAVTAVGTSLLPVFDGVAREIPGVP